MANQGHVRRRDCPREALRTAILPDMVAGNVTPEERERRWRHLAACYYVQQISHYPRDYILPEKNLPERVVETVERLEEDFVDRSHKNEPFHAVVEVGEAIPVGTAASPRRGATIRSWSKSTGNCSR